MSAKHTPGPWRLSHVEDGSIRHLVPVDAGGTSLLTIVNERGYDGCGESTPFAAVYSDEDARLMAAAPEMLESLLMLRTLIGRPGWALDGQNISSVVAAMHGAIAKATGEQS